MVRKGGATVYSPFISVNSYFDGRERSCIVEPFLILFILLPEFPFYLCFLSTTILCRVQMLEPLLGLKSWLHYSPCVQCQAKLYIEPLCFSELLYEYWVNVCEPPRIISIRIIVTNRVSTLQISSNTAFIGFSVTLPPFHRWGRWSGQGSECGHVWSGW